MQHGRSRAPRAGSGWNAGAARPWPILAESAAAYATHASAGNDYARPDPRADDVAAGGPEHGRGSILPALHCGSPAHRRRGARARGARSGGRTHM